MSIAYLSHKAEDLVNLLGTSGEHAMKLVLRHASDFQAASSPASGFSVVCSGRQWSKARYAWASKEEEEEKRMDDRVIGMSALHRGRGEIWWQQAP